MSANTPGGDRDIDASREELERAKLRLEIRELGRPEYLRPPVLFAAVSTIVAVVGVVAQSYLSTIKSERATLELARTERLKDSIGKEMRGLQSKYGDLNQQVRDLESRRRSLDAAVTSLVANAVKQPQAAAQQQVVQFAENARSGIGFYALEADPARFLVAQRALQDRGFALIRGGNLQQRPSWLSPRSTVLYYTSKSKGEAERLAVLAEQLMGKRFDVERGQGLGVTPGEEERTFYVHWIP
jgi:hypothetical protein